MDGIDPEPTPRTVEHAGEQRTRPVDRVAIRRRTDGGSTPATQALRFGEVSSVIVMDYSSLIWATLLGWCVFERLPPAATWLGAPLIIAAGLIIAWREHRLSIERARSLVGE